MTAQDAYSQGDRQTNRERMLAGDPYIADDPVSRDKLEAARPIAIGDNVWLGGGVIVLPGVAIGDNTVVGAGAVVSRDLPANVVAVGNPAQIVRHVTP